MSTLWSVIPLIGWFSQWARRRGYLRSFEWSSVPLYECIFTSFRVHLPFSSFEMEVMNHLRVSPSQIPPRAWTFMKVFQLGAEHKPWEPSLELFSISFSWSSPLETMLRIKDWSSFALKSLGLTFYMKMWIGMFFVNFGCLDNEVVFLIISKIEISWDW